MPLSNLNRLREVLVIFFVITYTAVLAYFAYTGYSDRKDAKHMKTQVVLFIKSDAELRGKLSNKQSELGAYVKGLIAQGKCNEVCVSAYLQEYAMFQSYTSALSKSYVSRWNRIANSVN